MAPWIMHSEVTRRPWRLRFYIGSIIIADIEFNNKKPWLLVWGHDYGPFNSVSEAMKHMHWLLNTPPTQEEPDGNSDLE